jgi:hypothetical protein
MTTTPLPEMSQQEASWHTHLAAMRAQETARNQGANPHAVDAFAAATAGPQMVHGFSLAPATEGTIWTLKRVAREFKAYADALGMPSAGPSEEDGTRELLELGISTLVFCDARQCFMDLEGGRLEAIIARADTLMWSIPLHVSRDLAEHFSREMQRIRNLTPDDEATLPGKLPEGNGTSPATPIPQGAAA